MASDPMAAVRSDIGRRLDEIHRSADRLSPLQLHARMESIRTLAALNGLAALEGLARCTAQMALLPGHRIALRHCLDRIADALDSRQSSDCTAILASLAIRLH